MKQAAKKLFSVFMITVLTLAMAFPAFSATITPNTGTQIVYRTTTTKNAESDVYVGLASGSKAFTIKRANVKVSPGTTGAKMTSFSAHKSNYKNTYAYSTSGKWTSNSYNNSYYDYEAGLTVKAAGTATVAYTIGSKTYKTKVKVLGYKNPAKSVVLTGVNGGKNFASLTKNNAYATKDMVVKAKKTGAKLTVKPISGWKISYVEFYDNTNGTSYGTSNYSKGLSAASLSCGNLVTNHSYSISVRFVNTSNKATIYCQYNVKGSKVK